jgi:Purple acid Phosphatase, N-terminal domain
MGSRRRHFSPPTLLLFSLFSIVVQWCPVVAAPRGVRLSLGDDPETSMRVSFSLIGASESLLGSSCLVQMALDSQFTIDNKTVSPPSFVGGYPRWENSTLVRFDLSGLSPNTEYFYRCGSSSGGFSPVYTLRTAPKPGARTVSLQRELVLLLFCF